MTNKTNSLNSFTWIFIIALETLGPFAKVCVLVYTLKFIVTLLKSGKQIWETSFKWETPRYGQWLTEIEEEIKLKTMGFEYYSNQDVKKERKKGYELWS